MTALIPYAAPRPTALAKRVQPIDPTARLGRRRQRDADAGGRRAGTERAPAALHGLGPLIAPCVDAPPPRRGLRADAAQREIWRNAYADAASLRQDDGRSGAMLQLRA